MGNDTFLIPRPGYAVFPLALPFLFRKEREAAARNRLRGEYPGSLEGTTLVLVPNGNQCWLACVFREVPAGDPLSLSTLAARKLCTTGKRYCVVAAASWMEYLLLENGAVLSTTVRGRTGAPLTEDLRNQAPRWFGPSGEGEAAIEVFCEEAPLPGNADAGALRCRFTPLATALGGISRASYSCFPEQLSGVRVRRAVLAVLSVCVLLAAVVVCRRWYAGREAGRQEAQAAARRSAEQAAAREAEEQRRTALAAEWAAVQAAEGISAGEVLATLAAAVSPAVRVIQATVHNGSFHLEGTSGSALSALERLLQHERIDAAIETVIREPGGERFTVSGTVRKAACAPEQEGSEWYEAQLAAFRLREANRAGSAAGAGVAVTQLLRRHGAAAERLRYLAAEGGWTIACSVTATPSRFAGIVEDASSPDHPWRVTDLETRNSSGEVAAVITFCVRGSAGERWDDGSGEYPGAARIAALYEGRPGGRQVPAALPAAPQPVSPPRAAERSGPAAVRQGVLEYVGAVGTDDGQQYIYVRDTAGNLVRLTEGKSTFGYAVQGGTMTAHIDGGAYEVRRNDGF